MHGGKYHNEIYLPLNYSLRKLYKVWLYVTKGDKNILTYQVGKENICTIFNLFGWWRKCSVWEYDVDIWKKKYTYQSGMKGKYTYLLTMLTPT